jgi:hypothetical protein
MQSGLAMIDRRMAIGGALAGAAGLALPFRQGRPVTQRGMAGGGLARLEPAGEANFSFFASRLIFAEGIPEAFFGSILWVDDRAGLILSSSSISAYTVLPNPRENVQSRQILGMMSVNEETEYPFEFVATNAGLPGAGPDTVSLTVGDGALTGDGATPAAGYGFTYKVTGSLESGDIQEIGITIDPEMGVVGPAEEA